MQKTVSFAATDNKGELSRELSRVQSPMDREDSFSLIGFTLSLNRSKSLHVHRAEPTAEMIDEDDDEDEDEDDDEVKDLKKKLKAAKLKKANLKKKPKQEQIAHDSGLVHIVEDSVDMVVDKFETYVEPYIFPIVPKSVDSFITFLAAHSMFLTLSTPLARFVRGRWMTVLSIEWVMRRMGISSTMVRDHMIHGDSILLYADEATSPGIDFYFGIHAFCGLMWILVAYIQMVPLRGRSLAKHRSFGYLAMLIFISHCCASLNLLRWDEGKHHSIVKVMLLSPVTCGAIYIVHAILCAKRKDITGHRDSAVLGFLFSIEGAGTIRTVGYLQELLANYIPSDFSGPSRCQGQYGGRATHCVISYCIRLAAIRVLTLYWIGIYGRYKNDSAFKKVFILETAMSVGSYVILIPLMYLDLLEGKIGYTILVTTAVLGHLVLPLFQFEDKTKIVQRTVTRIATMLPGNKIRSTQSEFQVKSKMSMAPPVKKSATTAGDTRRGEKLD